MARHVVHPPNVVVRIQWTSDSLGGNMRVFPLLCPVAVLLWSSRLSGFAADASATADMVPSKAVAQAAEVPYGTGNWDAQTFGNHRAVLAVGQAADAVWAHIPWRRRDVRPETKNIILIETDTGNQITNLARLAIASDFGDLVFQAPRAGTYYAYYLPSVARGRNYPSVSYQPPQNTASPEWVARNGLKSDAPAPSALDRFPRARVVEFQAIDQFNSFYPMEVCATDAELRQLLAAHPGSPFLLFPEDRMLPIRMTDRLPLKWIQEGPKSEFAGAAAPGEFYAFQVGVYAVSSDLDDVAVHFSVLQSAKDRAFIPSSSLRCINTGGTNWNGVAFAKRVAVAKGQVQALWCGVQVPENFAPGVYEGTVTIQPASLPAQTVKLSLTVAGKSLLDHGDGEPARQSRLRWLDSTLAQDDEVVKPYVPLKVADHTIAILGREMTVAASGLPAQVVSHFSPEGTELETTGSSLLAAPMELIAEAATGQRLIWTNQSCTFTKQNGGAAEWTAQSTAGPLLLEVHGRMEFDGFVRYQTTISAGQSVELADVSLRLPMLKTRARYIMGLGLQGSQCPTSFDWTWDVKKHQDSAWLGGVGAGLQFKLKDENYEPPLLTNFYEDKPLNMPPSWFNGGRGGISLRTANEAVIVNCFGGRRRLEAGQKLHFDFDLMLTPFKPLNTQAQWSTRFFHSYQPVADVVRSGANTVNIHHANDANPYINYPYLHVNQMRTYVAEAHRQKLKVKIYDTMRELSNHAAELFALRSLGDEIFPAGKGGGDAWLQEHLGTNYMPGWFVPQWKDAAIIDKGSTRWDNYYVEGLAWLVKNVGIDGLYIDDLAYDRTTMKRVRKVLDRGNPGALIDFHSANQFDPNDGFGSCANVYLEHFPYLDRLWFGEYFKPDSPPDFWLVEMSGIPFGLMGEMLQDGGNRWRGMLYGMTSRIPYDGNDPSPIWKVWDQFKIQDSRMMGYWSPRCPVKTGSTNILATVYVGRGRSLISIASWAAADEPVRLSFDWQALGLDPTKTVLTAPEIAGFQPAAHFKPGDSIPVPKGKGWLLYVEPE
jgi:hypothetical protein